MEVYRLGPHNLSYCACCGVLISNQISSIPDGMDELHNQLKAHLDLTPSCGVYYDNLPTFDDVRGILSDQPPESEE